MFDGDVEITGDLQIRRDLFIRGSALDQRIARLEVEVADLRRRLGLSGSGGSGGSGGIGVE
jgi:hypothetical protein